MILLGIVLILIGVIMIVFNVPYSKTKTEFDKVATNMTTIANEDKETFSKEDIIDLPMPVQKYYEYCGFIGLPKMQTMRIVYKDVPFRFGKDKSAMNIDYVQYNVANKPDRIAYIDSSKLGIPFEGFDSYITGKGSMKGVLGKFFTLFHQTGETMDKACLVTYLSECLTIPSAAIQEYIIWEEIDPLHAKATISYYGKTASGVFTFNEKGELCSFTTNDRENVSMDGKVESVEWTAYFGKYKDINGIKMPTVLQAAWHYEDGDLLYFDGKDVVIEYDSVV